MISPVPDAVLEEIGRLVLGVVSTTLAKDTGSALVGAMIQRFGEAWLRDRVDYHAAILATADTAADLAFLKKE